MASALATESTALSTNPLTPVEGRPRVAGAIAIGGARGRGPGKLGGHRAVRRRNRPTGPCSSFPNAGRPGRSAGWSGSGACGGRRGGYRRERVRRLQLEDVVVGALPG